MHSTLVPVDPGDDTAIDAYHSVAASVRAADQPDLPPLTRTVLGGMIRYPRPTIGQQSFVIHRDGQPAAALGVQLPEADNTHVALVEPMVHPDHRRQGLGRALFDAARTLAREHGRRVLIGDYCAQLPSGPRRDPAAAAFATAVRARTALVDIRRRLDLDTVDASGWSAQYDGAVARSAGYPVVTWEDAAPDEFAPDLAYLDGRMVTDSPMGELDYEPEKVDVDRIRATEEMLRLRGSQTYHAGARDGATGRLVAWSALTFEVDNTDHAWQGITIVDPDHRGHRLGLLVKLANLLRVRQIHPQLRQVDTWNAEENGHMIAINEAIGFRAVEAWVNWQYSEPAAGEAGLD